ncbi:putative tRNA exportin [Paratrimastix pyriformis]|uniref:Exportin-T n=1 Tax=Paratrimastix pyriformis TaxID=342808 RepID=A0ABQ8UUZ4_9EUKA|nr:putative tRNA exportin [Paratrimastix pyriformis]
MAQVRTHVVEVIHEIVHKKAAPPAKLQLLHSLGLLAMIARFPTSTAPAAVALATSPPTAPMAPLPLAHATSSTVGSSTSLPAMMAHLLSELGLQLPKGPAEAASGEPDPHPAPAGSPAPDEHNWEARLVPGQREQLLDHTLGALVEHGLVAAEWIASPEIAVSDSVLECVTEEAAIFKRVPEAHPRYAAVRPSWRASSSCACACASVCASAHPLGAWVVCHKMALPEWFQAVPSEDSEDEATFIEYRHELALIFKVRPASRPLRLHPITWTPSPGPHRLDPIAWTPSPGPHRLDPIAWTPSPDSRSSHAPFPHRASDYFPTYLFNPTTPPNQTLGHIMPDGARTLLQEYVALAVGQMGLPGAASASALELPCELLFHWADLIPDTELTSPGTVAMVRALLGIPIHQHPNRVAVMKWLEVLVRYMRLFPPHPDLVFLSDSTVGRASDLGVQARTAYLLLRVLRALAGPRCVLQTIPASTELALTVTYNLYEAAGLILGNATMMPLDQRTQALKVLLATLIAQLDGVVTQPVTPPLIQAAGQTITALGHLCVGFTRSDIHGVFPDALQAVARVAQWAATDDMRSKARPAPPSIMLTAPLDMTRPAPPVQVIFYVRRMAEVVGAEVLAVLQPLTPILIGTAELSIITEVLGLVKYLVHRFRQAQAEALAPVLAAVMPPLLGRVLGLLGTEEGAHPMEAVLKGGHVVAPAEVDRERHELAKNLVILVQTIVPTARLLAVLQEGGCATLLGALLNAVVQAAGAHPDILVRRAAIQSLSGMVPAWAAQAGFSEFLFQQAVPAAVRALATPPARREDAQSMLLANDAAAFHGTCQKCLGGAFLEWVTTVMAPSLAPTYRLTGEQCQALVEATAQLNAERLQQFYAMILPVTATR